MKTRPHVGAVMQARPNHESSAPSPSLVSSRPEVSTTSSALPLPQPAAGKAKGRAMVLRRNRARRVLLRTGDDHALGGRRPVESGNFLPGRSNPGTAERLDKLFTVGTSLGKHPSTPSTPPSVVTSELRSEETGYNPPRLPL